MILGYTRSGTVLWASKVKGQGDRVKEYIFHTNVLSIRKKTNDPKLFKLGIGNDLGISYKWHGFGFKGQKVNVNINVNIRRGFELYEYLLVQFSCSSSDRYAPGASD